MNALKIAASITAVAFLLGGCASSSAYKDYLDNVNKANQAVIEKDKAKASAEESKYMALAYIAKTSTDPATKQMAVMAIALGQQGGGGGVTAQPVAPQMPQNEALQWASILVNPIVTLGTGYYGYKSNINASNNAASTAIASYNAFQGISTAGLNTASNIATAGFTSNTNIATAGFGAVDALGRPNVTVTGNGNGVQLGDGTQTVTTHNCNPAGSGNTGAAGNGAAGGTGTVAGSTGGSGGLGGASGASGAVSVNCN